uniref:DUF674 family protein n=1 Tax=Solanum lycopersicum TaxID=4081 RepID=A0A3Q7HV02_SOLLC
MTASKVTMKLLIDSKSKKVMFAEAGKECIDFLFHILALPIGSVIRLLTTEGMVGCLGNLYDSLQNLDNIYIQPNQKKDTLLKPKSAASVPLLLINNSPVQKQFNRCSNHYDHVTDDPRSHCPSPSGVGGEKEEKREKEKEKKKKKGMWKVIPLLVSSLTRCPEEGNWAKALQFPFINRPNNHLFLQGPNLSFEAVEDFSAVQECVDQCFHGQHK